MCGWMCGSSKLSGGGTRCTITTAHLLAQPMVPSTASRSHKPGENDRTG